MRRFFIILLAFFILNQSIDLDYVVYSHSCWASVADDDMDSILEFILEKMMDDDNFMSEEDDDSGTPQNKGLEKYNPGPLYFEHFTKPQLFYAANYNSSWTTGLDQANKICKGYFNIISPPPKA